MFCYGVRISILIKIINVLMSKNIRYDRFLLNYQGNKYQETKKHLGDFISTSNYDIIAEPFCGIFGFSRAYFELKPDFKGEIWLNDIDKDLIDNLIRLRDEPEKLINEIKEYIEPFENDKSLTETKDKPYIISIIYRGMSGHLMNLKKGNQKIKNHDILKYSNFFKNVKFFNMSSDEFINMVYKIDNKHILIYCDPPYFNSNNKGYQKYCSLASKNEYHDGTSLYLDIFKRMKLKKDNIDIMLIMNKLDIINYTFRDYIFLEYNGLYQNFGKSLKKHIIYLN